VTRDFVVPAARLVIIRAGWAGLSDPGSTWSMSRIVETRTRFAAAASVALWAFPGCSSGGSSGAPPGSGGSGGSGGELCDGRVIADIDQRAML